MKWPWQRVENRAPENRATLTIFPDRVVMGMPHNATEQEAYVVQQRLLDWDERGRTGVVVFPFPVDVAHQPEPIRLDLSAGSLHTIARQLAKLTEVLERMERSSKRRPRVTLCRHPELHDVDMTELGYGKAS